jgi:hypothetical protein
VPRCKFEHLVVFSPGRNHTRKNMIGISEHRPGASKLSASSWRGQAMKTHGRVIGPDGDVSGTTVPSLARIQGFISLKKVSVHCL